VLEMLLGPRGTATDRTPMRPPAGASICQCSSRLMSSRAPDATSLCRMLTPLAAPAPNGVAEATSDPACSWPEGDVAPQPRIS
jgi:hypothetical protein